MQIQYQKYAFYHVNKRKIGFFSIKNSIFTIQSQGKNIVWDRIIER